MMTTDQFAGYQQVWFVDFEFSQLDGNTPTPICMVARELRSGRLIRCWQDELADLRQAPFPVDENALFVAYYASAEIGCFLALNWPLPTRILDLFAEFRCLTNGSEPPCGSSLLGALFYFGLDALGGSEKESMRQLAMRGGAFSDRERLDLLDYCQTDVDSLVQLFFRMMASIDLPRALLRGRYMAAAARMERTGIPTDTGAMEALRTHWPAMQSTLIEAIDQRYGTYVASPSNGPSRHYSFSTARFHEYLRQQGIPWPQLPTGGLDLKDDTFRDVARRYPQIEPLRQLRSSLSALRLNHLQVGCDGRNRCLLSAFRARTGRNQPSNSRFIFGPAAWIRHLIRPPAGRAIAYVDWAQQEFGIAAALSHDSAMMEAYVSEDPYLTFAKQAGAIPASASKASHPMERERFKVCALGVQYGMAAESLGAAIGGSQADGRELLRLHQQTYSQFWRWSENVVNCALVTLQMRTVFGWRLHVHSKPNSRSLANFPMQANGAEMLRLACCLATERGVDVCAPVHDALLIEASSRDIECAVERTRAAMREASRGVLDGFELREDVKIYRDGERFSAPRGVEMWGTVCRLLHELGAPVDGLPGGPCEDQKMNQTSHEPIVVGDSSVPS